MNHILNLDLCVYHFLSWNFNRPQDTINFNANYSVHYPVFDAQMLLPNRNVFYSRVWKVSFMPLSAYYPYSVSGRHSSHYMGNWKNWRSSKCTIDAYIHTFDDTEYLANLTNCYHIMAKDCSPKETFTIMVANTTDKVYSKVSLICETYPSSMESI